MISRKQKKPKPRQRAHRIHLEEFQPGIYIARCSKHPAWIVGPGSGREIEKLIKRHEGAG